MLTPDSFQTYSINKHPRGDAISRILASSINAVDPGALVKQNATRKGDSLWVDGTEHPLTKERIVLLGLGKAAESMTSAMVDLVGDLNPRGLIIPKTETGIRFEQIEVVIGDHPIPGENSLLAGKKVMELTEGLTEKDLLICLISGGGSSLMAAPHSGLSLNEVSLLYTSLLTCGASIDEINTIRRHIDQLKGGRLIRKVNGARVISLILSDVIGNPLEAIASGPTAPDPTTRFDALAILEKYHLHEKIPASIPRIINSARETAKPGDGIFDKVSNNIIGNNELAVKAAIDQAQKEGYHCRNMGSTWQGDARTTARELCAFLDIPGLEKPCCLIGGGETSVSVKGKGRGGRNQELALAAVKELAGIKDVMLISLATDGEEGVTDAAGAVTSNESLQRADNLGMDAGQFLENNDSYSYFDSLGDLIRTGPTGTNVNDLFFLFCH